MDKRTASVVFPFFVFIVVYLLFAFVNVSFDIATWSMDARALCAIIGGVMAMIGFCAVQ